MGGNASKRKGSAVDERGEGVYIPPLMPCPDTDERARLREERRKRGKASKGKGYRNEKKTEKFLQDCGLRADRDGRPGRKDVFFWLPGQQQPRKAESKWRQGGEGFKTLNKWLGTNDLMIVWERGVPGKIYMSADTFRELVAQKEGE